MSVPEESLHTALSTRVSVLSSFTVSESGVLSSYSTTAEYIPERRRSRTSSSPASIWSRLSTEPLALRRTIVLQRALTAPRMCPALKARKERQSSSRHLALSSFNNRFTTGQSISRRSPIARRILSCVGRLHCRLSPRFGSRTVCPHHPPKFSSCVWFTLFTHCKRTTPCSQSAALSLSFSLSLWVCIVSLFPCEWVHRVGAEVTSTPSSQSKRVQFPVPFSPLPFIHKIKNRHQWNERRWGRRLDSMGGTVKLATIAMF